jgi:hypothetical protein
MGKKSKSASDVALSLQSDVTNSPWAQVVLNLLHFQLDDN